ncbi:hypothetical protein [Effusibacillus lacus]|uniref:Uncharacterized protein n=1 Tax=Effusibacillus lacus TaxID=1348429 RepID=A0A292YSA2_9BACL|nr:hypothetical protein [Effusibacillus lacus]TCS74985.1 hypothetical protein EDD64_110109 [Effusibacillus lacus]GAX91653.1 hypothetical protein EFBL_3343 [Effusibacillus lacus]
MKKKTIFGVSLALAAAVIAGQMALAQEEDNKSIGNMKKMMENQNMTKMMEGMNTPEGQEMMKACSKFMESNSNKTGTKEERKN